MDHFFLPDVPKYQAPQSIIIISLFSSHQLNSNLFSSIINMSSLSSAQIADTVLRKEKMFQTKTTEWHNELKPTENELKMKVCLLTVYLNHFNKNRLMFARTLKKLSWFFFLLRHSKVNLRTSTYIFHKSTAPANIYSAAFGTF